MKSQIFRTKFFIQDEHLPNKLAAVAIFELRVSIWKRVKTMSIRSFVKYGFILRLEWNFI